MRHLLFPWILFLLSTSSLAQSSLVLDDLWHLPAVGQPRLSPDEKQLLYTLTTTDFVANSRRTDLYLLDIKRGEKEVLWEGAHDAQWTPRGRAVSFRATLEGTHGIYLKDLRSSERPRLLAPLHAGNHFLGHESKRNYAWSPDGRYLAYVSADPESGRPTADANAPIEIDRPLYKSRTGLSDLRSTRIYLLEVASQRIAPITSADHHSHSLSWAPDGQRLAFVSNRTEQPDDNHNNDVWVYELETRQTRPFTQTAGTEYAPAWHPKESALAYLATRRERNTKDSPAEGAQLYLQALAGGPVQALSRSLDRRPQHPQWHPAGDWLYFTAYQRGRQVLYRSRAGQVSPEVVIEGTGMVDQVFVGKKQLVYRWQSPQQPAEIYLAALDGSDQRRLTFETRAWLEPKTLPSVEEFWFTSFDGLRVQGFVSLPQATPAPTQRIPVIHRIHGGPHYMDGYRFSAVNAWLVARGYAVVFFNPRGSTGYGQQFADGTLEAWGAGDYRDLMAGMDYALRQYPFLDEERMGVSGISYGGYMTNWIITQTDRYRGAVSIGSLSNLVSFYGTSLYQLLIETEFNGFPWERYDLLWHRSPLAHVRQARTPTLFLHGALDMDVPITQAEEFYMALHKLGVPTRLVRYPNEGHAIQQPHHLKHYLEAFVGWMDEYVKQDP